LENINNNLSNNIFDTNATHNLKKDIKIKINFTIQIKIIYHTYCYIFKHKYKLPIIFAVEPKILIFKKQFMENTNPNFKTIQLIYGSLIFGVIAFLLFTVSSVKQMFFSYLDGSPFVFLVPVFFIAGVFLSPFLFKKSMMNIHKNESLYAKLTKYQGANIMRGAPLEAAGLMAVAAFMLTGNTYYLIFMFAVIFMMIAYFPTKIKFSNSIELSMEDQQKLNQL